MLLLDSEALSAVAHGPASRRDRVRALIVEMRRRELPIATVAARDPAAADPAELTRGNGAAVAATAAVQVERDARIVTAAGVSEGTLQ